MTITAFGFRRSSSFFTLGRGLGQGMSATDRDHYLAAVNRALDETAEIDKWIKDHPDIKFRPGSGAPAATTDSPYYTKWINYQAHVNEMKALKERLSDPDPANWFSLTQEEHGTFGWVSVVDTVYGAFQANPLNLVAGRWENGSRLPDEQIQVQAPATPSYLMPVLIGAGVLGMIGVVMLVRKKK